MGLKFLHNSGSSFITMGTTLARLHRSGKIPVSNDRLKRFSRLFEIKYLLTLIIYIGIIFGPVDLFKSRESIISEIL